MDILTKLAFLLPLGLVAWALFNMAQENAHIDANTELKWLKRGHSIQLANSPRTATYFLGRGDGEMPQLEVRLPLTGVAARDSFELRRMREWSLPTEGEPSRLVSEPMPLTIKGSPAVEALLKQSAEFLAHIDRIEAMRPRGGIRNGLFGRFYESASLVEFSLRGQVLSMNGSVDTEELPMWLREFEELGATVTRILE